MNTKSELIVINKKAFTFPNKRLCFLSKKNTDATDFRLETRISMSNLQSSYTL